MSPDLPSVQDQVASLWGRGDADRLVLEPCGCRSDKVTGVITKFCPAHEPRNVAPAAPAPQPDEPGPDWADIGRSLAIGQSITLRIPGKPQPGGSKRAFVPKGWTRPVITDANPAAMDWKRTVQAVALAKATGRILDGPLRVSMTFVLARPQGHFGKRGLRPSAPVFPAVKPDVLKLARSTEDALTGIIWKDDARIVTEILQKRYTTNGRTGAVIVIEEIVG